MSPSLHRCPFPLNGTRPGVNRSVVTFTEAIMCSLLVCLLQKIHGYLPGDSCCFITSFPMPTKAEKSAIQGMRQRLQPGNQAGKQAAAEILWNSLHRTFFGPHIRPKIYPTESHQKHPVLGRPLPPTLGRAGNDECMFRSCISLSTLTSRTNHPISDLAS